MAITQLFLHKSAINAEQNKRAANDLSLREP